VPTPRSLARNIRDGRPCRRVSRRRRRALIPKEAVKLVEAAEAGSIVLGMTGLDRAVLYALAIGTGLRSTELPTLTPERFDFDSEPPTLTVLACYAKTGRKPSNPGSEP
jgi:integrase